MADIKLITKKTMFLDIKGAPIMRESFQRNHFRNNNKEIE